MTRLSISRSAVCSLLTSVTLVALALVAIVGASEADAASAAIRLSATSGVVGSSLSVSGDGFPSRTIGSVLFGTTTTATYKTSRTGSFRVSFAVPASAAGPVEVAAQVASIRVAAGYTVTEVPAVDVVATDESTTTTTSTSPTSTTSTTSTTTTTIAPTTTSSTSTSSTTSTSTTTTSAPATSLTSTSSSSSIAVRPFASTSAWNSLIPAAPALDPNSGAQVAWLSGTVSATANPAVANLYNYGVPIWEADAATPKYKIDCVKAWGTCGLELELVPVPDGATATPVEKDGAMVVVDASTNRSYEFYEGQKLNSVWQAGWGGVLSTVGDGVGTAANSATGSAVSRLAGVVRISEIKAGVIDHALVFSTDNACTSTFRYPAAKTDGRSNRSDCVPEGARIQLDPSIDVDALPMTSGERIVAKALQRYGAYAIDNGGAKMAFIFEVPSGEADPYASVGLTRDYFAMNAIPWRSLRVLKSWTGG